MISWVTVVTVFLMGQKGSVTASGCKRGAQQLVGAHEQVFLFLGREF